MKKIQHKVIIHINIYIIIIQLNNLDEIYNY